VSSTVSTIPAAAEDVPDFGKAEPGSPLDQLDRLHADLAADAESRAADLWARTESRELALLRGAPDPFPSEENQTESAPTSVTFPGIRDARPARLLPGCFNQSPEEFGQQVAASHRKQLASLRSGEQEPISTRRLDFDPQTGAYTSRRRRRGAQWSAPEVVAVARAHTPAVKVSRVRRSQRGASRPAFRRTAPPARAGPDDDGASEPEPAHSQALCAVWRVSSLDGLTSFHEEADRFLVGVPPDLVGATKGLAR
jgi:hypothetical protein